MGGEVYTGASVVFLSIMVVVDRRDGHDTCEQRQRSNGISVYGIISFFNGIMIPICVETYVTHVKNIHVVTYHNYHMISFS